MSMFYLPSLRSEPQQSESDKIAGTYVAAIVYDPGLSVQHIELWKGDTVHSDWQSAYGEGVLRLVSRLISLIGEPNESDGPLQEA